VLRHRPVSATPAITFAIPFYSGAAYLARAIESILAQDDDAWQAVVVDDGAEPGIEARVRAYGDRIAYVRNPTNLGMGNNFNRCIDLATTELVTVFHADDELAPSYTRTMRAAAARHPTAPAVFCRTHIIGPDHQPQFSLADTVKDYLVHPSPHRELELAGERGVRALLKANFIPAPTLCFRKAVLGDRRFPPQYKFVLDWELTTRLLFDGDTLVGIPDRCYRYRRHEAAATSQYTRTHLRFREESEFYDRMVEATTARGWNRCAAIARHRRMTKLNVTYLALRSVAALQLKEARRNLELLREL
jgi:glycosyltransferase involved in cell wall biosynthesis